ncbi:MAG: anhydro-N-acetylmuramic acid kinase [Nitrospirae bacterium]|nr:anhydro-N-acetylmuramic acid kinase [Nitrospirota bacterium]MBF0534567.1 anhydro-N-acetylmuramic acid kinase [Nitrospirota bacterium]MBF0617602.1 anhydro-N-acetylmuramic acid kinase [Nitrospirota bacterium]
MNTQLNSKKIIGLMSGTSHDGVDGALVEITRVGINNAISVNLLHNIHLPYPEKLRVKIRTAFNGNTEAICRLNFELGEIFALCANKLIAASGAKTSDIALVASHGQTICHIPPVRAKWGSTLQIGESSIIAARTGIVTVSDFRPKDMAYGGQGAPLVPLSDYLMFKKQGAITAVLNIGGMANVTILTESIEDLIAFDTGPGNSLIDDTVMLLSGGKHAFDKDGIIARGGILDKNLLNELMKHPYLKKKPPKSTGRETFGKTLSEDIFYNRYSHLKKEDIVCTLTHFTAKTIFNSISPYKPTEIIVTGGGVKNTYLMELLSGLFLPTGADIKNISEYGIPPEAKEAVSFAVLGYRALIGLPGNVPSATGASRSTILGKFTYP